MKTLPGILAIILCIFSLQFVSCSKKHDPKTTTDIQLDKLRTEWKITRVTNDGIPQDGYANLILSFTGDNGSQSFNYAASGRPFVSPWEGSGAFSFDANNPVAILHRNDGLDVDYSVTETTLTLQFNFNGPGYVNGRTSALTGAWKFEFQKQ